MWKGSRGVDGELIDRFSQAWRNPFLSVSSKNTTYKFYSKEAPRPDLICTPSNSPDHQNSHAMLISLTVGKVDAGVAVLLTEDKRLVSSALCSPGAMASSGATRR